MRSITSPMRGIVLIFSCCVAINGISFAQDIHADSLFVLLKNVVRERDACLHSYHISFQQQYTLTVYAVQREHTAKRRITLEKGKVRVDSLVQSGPDFPSGVEPMLRRLTSISLMGYLPAEDASLHCALSQLGSAVIIQGEKYYILECRSVNKNEKVSVERVYSLRAETMEPSRVEILIKGFDGAGNLATRMEVRFSRPGDFPCLVPARTERFDLKGDDANARTISRWQVVNTGFEARENPPEI